MWARNAKKAIEAWDGLHDSVKGNATKGVVSALLDVNDQPPTGEKLARAVGFFGELEQLGFPGLPKLAAATTPAGRLASSQRVGTGVGAAVSGPSIASVAKPIGFGKALPGAMKNQI